MERLGLCPQLRGGDLKALSGKGVCLLETLGLHQMVYATTTIYVGVFGSCSSSWNSQGMVD